MARWQETEEAVNHPQRETKGRQSGKEPMR